MNYKSKMLIGTLAIATFISGSSITYANDVPQKENTTINQNQQKENEAIIYTNAGEKILDLSDKQYQKIKWDKPFIAVNQLDKANIKEFKRIQKETNNVNISNDDIKTIFNKGLSGDFISINQITSGMIKTKYGDFNILRTTESFGASRLTICNETICTGDIYLKPMDKVSGLIYGKFNKLLPEEKGVLNLQENDNIGLVRIKMMDLLKSKSIFLVKYNNVDNNIYHLSFDKSNLLNTSTENKNEFHGQLNDSKSTEIDLLISTDKTMQALILKDGTKVYTRLTEHKDILDLFYLDWDENNPYELQVINIGKINKNDLNIEK